MSAVLLITGGIYVLLLSGLVNGGLYLQLKKELRIKTKRKDTFLLDDLTVIIPFRNEEKRISGLLEAIRSAKRLPKMFLFVDDHSTDRTVEKIQTDLEGLPFALLSLDKEEGKKHAIRRAMLEVDTAWVLSMDADIRFEAAYFEHLSELQLQDACILPVKMNGTKWYHAMFELDVLLVNAVNAGINGWTRPIIASGANLIYSKQAFDAYDRFESHSHMPSGDDIYLLRDFRRGGATVDVLTDPLLAIETETPQSFHEFIQQRLRWIAKTGDVADHLSTILSAIQAAFTLFFFGCFVTYLIIGDFSVALLIIGVKTVIDSIVFLPFFLRMNRGVRWFWLPVYELFFPLYSLLILTLMYTYRPVWKGRKLSKNY
jgi:glycosyltransferase involved in cell wall biosynthesis